MADQVVLKADLRASSGKQAAKQLRATGKLPAIVYGKQTDPVVCAVDHRALSDLLRAHGRNAIINLEAGTQAQSTIIKEIQHDPLRGDILHVDFHSIDLTQKIVVEVLVESEGIPFGVRNDGGILEHMLHHIEVECLPMEIPERIVVDVSALGVGDNLHVSDITLENPNQQIVTDGERALFSVAAPTLQKEEGAEEAVEEEMQEPEVIERGKKDDDDDEEDS